MKKVLCICLSTTIQKTVHFDDLVLENVNRSKSYRIDASGKAINSARVLNQLENDCAKVICPIGQKNVDLFLELSKKDNLQIEYILVPGFTRECLTLLNSKKASTTEIVISEPTIDFDVELKEKELLQMVLNSIDLVDAVLFAGSKPSCWSDNLIPKIAKIAIDANKIFFADYHGKDLLNTIQVAVPSIIKINSDEFISTFNLSKNIDEENLKKEIIKQSLLLNNIFVVTRGHLSTYASFQNNFWEQEIEKIIPVNTTACGDSFSAGFLYEYINSKNIELSLEKGTLCATLNAKSDVPGTIK